MKKLVFICLLITQSFFAQNGFEIGNSLYQKGNYEGAITAYENVLQTQKQSAELYFNLGNCYYKLNKVAPAIYNYEKALVLNPGDAEIQNNLRFAHKMTIDEIKDVPKVGFAKMLRDFTGNFSYDGWAWISVAFAGLFLLFFLGYYFSGTTLLKRMFFVGMFVVVFLILIGVMAAVSEKNYYETERPAIVFAEMASVKSEPKAGGSDVFVLHEGTKVYVEETLDDWKKIQLTDGTQGWIESSAIKEVK
jgi:tetratricopeptide (TPR) repeat protein